MQTGLALYEQIFRHLTTPAYFGDMLDFFQNTNLNTVQTNDFISHFYKQFYKRQIIQNTMSNVFIIVYNIFV